MFNLRKVFGVLLVTILVSSAAVSQQTGEMVQAGTAKHDSETADAGSGTKQSSKSGPLLEEVVVTAQKREQSLADIPMSITAFTGDDIKALGFNQPRDLAQYTTGLYVKPTVGDQNPVFTIRGVGFNDFTPIQSPAVAVYVNQVVVPYHPMMSFQLLDLERVEVVKGPQGTLYGRNSTAGAVNFITRKPGEEFNGRARLDVSNYSTYEFEGAVGGPLSETVSVRVALGTYQRDDSYQLNRVNDNGEYGSKDRISGRLMLSWMPADNVNLLLDLHGGSDKSGPTALEHLASVDAVTFQELCSSVAAGFRDEGPCINFGGYFDPDDDPYAGDYSVINGGVDNDSWGFSVTATWDLSDHFILTSITGYDEFNRDQLEDIDASPFVFIDVSFDDETKAFSQEFRLSSKASTTVDWIVGAFYSNDSVVAIQDIDASDLVGTRAVVSNDQDNKSIALFADAEWDISNRWQLNGGLRFTRDKKNWTGGSDFVGFASLVNSDKISDLDISGKISGEFRPHDNWMLYASLSKAYRSGGFPGGFTLNPAALQPFDKEEVYAFETGFKTTLSDGSVQLDGAFYFYDWRDIQTQMTFVDPVTGLPSLVLTNAGDAEIKGLELSLNWAISNNFLLKSGLNIQSGKIVESDDPRLQDKELANSPDVTFNILARYEVPLKSGRLVLQGGASYTDERFFTSDNTPVFFGEDYWLTDARISYFDVGDKWQFAAWVKNLTNEEYRMEGFNQFGFSGDSYHFYGEPRTYGVSLSRYF